MTTTATRRRHTMALHDLLAAARRADACEPRTAEAEAWLRANPGATLADAARARPDDAGWLACFAPGLTADQRMELALASTPEWRGVVACHAPDLTPEQRAELREGDTQ